MLKKMISFTMIGMVMMVVVVVGFTGCGQKMATTSSTTTNAKDVKKTYTFGATYMTMNNPFFGAVNDGIKSVLEPQGHKVITLDPALDLHKQIAQVEDLIAQHVDAIFLNPVDWQGIKPALEEAKQAGIPIINVDAPVSDEDLVTSIVASDNYNAGILVAQDVIKKLHSAKVVILEHPTAKSAQDRTKSFEAYMKDKPQYEIVAKQSSNGQLEQAMPVMENIIEAQPIIDVVMALNDPTALGALAALESADRADKTLIYGVDGSPDGKKMVKEGKLEGTAAQSPKNIGTTAADVALKVLAGETVDHLILVPVELITKENVDQYGVEGWQ